MTMRSMKKMLHEIEQANIGQGPDVTTWTSDPYLMGITMAQLRLAAAEADLDTAVVRARGTRRSWQQCGEFRCMTKQGANNRLGA